MTDKRHSPNDDRAIVKNPNNPAHAADQKNRQKQAQGEAKRPAKGSRPKNK